MTIYVHNTPIPDQVWSGIRSATIAITSFCLAKGWIDNDMLVLLTALGGIVWPLVVGQLKTRQRAEEVATLATHVSDSVATFR